MEKAATVLAINLRDAIAHKKKYRSISELARASGVAATSIGYMLNPETRQRSKSGKTPTPTLETLEAVAKALDLSAWQLIYPAPDKSYQSFQSHRFCGGNDRGLAVGVQLSESFQQLSFASACIG